MKQKTFLVRSYSDSRSGDYRLDGKLFMCRAVPMALFPGLENKCNAKITISSAPFKGAAKETVTRNYRTGIGAFAILTPGRENHIYTLLGNKLAEMFPDVEIGDEFPVYFKVEPVN